MVRLLRRCVLCLLLLAGGDSAVGDPAWPYPIGTSDQAYDEQKFEIHIPDDVHDPKAGYSLIVTVTGDTDDLSHLSVDRYIIVAPRPKSGIATRWSAAEIKSIYTLTKYLSKQLGVEEHRVHAVGMHEIQGVFSMAVFGKGSPFVSATFLECAFRGGSISGHLKKKLGVLAFDYDGANSEGIRTMPEALAGKVKTIELRSDSAGLHGDYFKYWLDVMDGRFTPGHDLSFDWETESEAAQDIPVQVKARGKAALIYFWSPTDKDNANTMALQNDVFLDPAVRAYRRTVMPFMLQREDHTSLFNALTFKETPGVAVIGKDGKTKILQGAIKAKALAKAMKRATK